MTTYDQWKLQGPPEGPPFESWPLRERCQYWRDQIKEQTKALHEAIEQEKPTSIVTKYVDDLIASYESLIEEE